MKGLTGLYFAPGLMLVALYIVPANLGLLKWLPNWLLALLWLGWFLTFLLFFMVYTKVMRTDTVVTSFLYAVSFLAVCLSALIPGRTYAVELYGGLIEEAMSAPPTTLASLSQMAERRSFRVHDIKLARVVTPYMWCHSYDEYGLEDCDMLDIVSAIPRHWSVEDPIRHWVEVPRRRTFCEDARRVHYDAPPGPTAPFDAGEDCGEGMIYTNRRLTGDAKRALDKRCEKLGYTCQVEAYLGVVGSIENQEDGSWTVTHDPWTDRPSRYDVTRDEQGVWTATPSGLWKLLMKEMVQAVSLFAVFVWGIPGCLLWMVSRFL